MVGRLRWWVDRVGDVVRVALVLRGEPTVRRPLCLGAARVHRIRGDPHLDGNTLDLIIDFFTCTIVPVAFLDRFDILPAKTIGPMGFAILFVSALWMSRTDQETPDGWFNGYPAEWNMIIPTLYLLHPNRWFSLGVCAVFCMLTLSRLEFPHPVSVREERPVTLMFLLLWLGSMTWLTVAQHDMMVARIVLIIAPAWTVLQVLRRFASGRQSGDDRTMSDVLVAHTSDGGAPSG